MNKNELRIGNWVKFDHQFFQITAIGINDLTAATPAIVMDISIADTEMLGFNPIPITRELLEKTLGPNDDSWKNPENHFELIGNAYLEWFEHDGEAKIHVLPFDQTEDSYIGDVKYVHELQNLYFALHRQEINIPMEVFSKT